MSNSIRIQNLSRHLKLSSKEDQTDKSNCLFRLQISQVQILYGFPILLWLQQFLLDKSRIFQSMDFPQKGILYILTKSTVTFYGMFQKPICVNPDCPCLDDTDDDEDLEIMRRRRRRKKKPSIPKTPCRSYSPKQPDNPESHQYLHIYNKALRQIQQESSSKHVPTQ